MIKKAGALIIEKKQLLIVKPRGKPFWVNPGGKYEKLYPGTKQEREETPQECLERELDQELKVKLEGFNYYNTYLFEKAAHANDSLELQLFQVFYSGVLMPSSEIESYAWMSREDFEAKKYNTAPSFEKFIADLVEQGLL